MNLSNVLDLLGAVLLAGWLTLTSVLLTQAKHREHDRWTDARALRNAKRERLWTAYIRLAG